MEGVVGVAKGDLVVEEARGPLATAVMVGMVAMVAMAVTMAKAVTMVAVAEAARAEANVEATGGSDTVPTQVGMAGRRVMSARVAGCTCQRVACHPYEPNDPLQGDVARLA